MARSGIHRHVWDEVSYGAQGWFFCPYCKAVRAPSGRIFHESKTIREIDGVTINDNPLAGRGDA
jgi:hypothetical protein